MIEGEIILAEYRQIAELTHGMLDAARRGEWDAVIQLERDCSLHFARLIDCDPQQPDDVPYRSRKAELIRGILDDDAEIRLLAEPWLKQLSVLIGNTQQQSRLHRAYRPGE